MPRRQLEMSRLWMRDHPALAVAAILDFMDENPRHRITAEPYPTENFLTLSATPTEE